jgi:hypothetical protein
LAKLASGRVLPAQAVRCLDQAAVTVK